MANYTQANRPIAVTTPFGPDVLLLAGFTGHEGISELFRFELDLLAENKTAIAFDKLLGQKVTVSLECVRGIKRYFNGICSRLSEGKRDDTFTHYRMEVVPQFWLLTRRMQSRIFQHVSVPDILKKVLEGLDVKCEIQGTFHPRDYCVQYRETDFNFASRLMEEEGIYYFFKHKADGHQIILANTPKSHADVPEQSKVIYEEIKGGLRPDMRIIEWEKSQEVCSGKYTLWDHCFELPHKHLEADKAIVDAVPVGKVTHKLNAGGNGKLEIYDYPGSYAQRFDGIDRGGSARPAELTKIFDDNKRTVEIRMQQEALRSLQIRGLSNCGQFVSGHKFTLERHFNADADYLLTSVDHSASLSTTYRSGEAEIFEYQNRFTCIPLSMPYRPPLATEKPVVKGSQTAVVVGPPGEQIFCDKYGRVKVQFHWDREGKRNADSSCWIRVSNPWGGKGWGGNFLPHVGQEVIVDFEEGDPDRPIILGRVYNAEMMPPMSLPGHKTKSIIRDQGGNQICMEGADGAECIVINSPCGRSSMSIGAVPPSIAPIGSGLVEDFKSILPRVDVGPSISFFSDGDWNAKMEGDFKEVIKGWKNLEVEGNSKNYITGDILYATEHNWDNIIKGDYTCRVDGYQEYTTRGNYTTNVMGQNHTNIIGLNHTKMFAMQVNIIVGVKLEYEKSWVLFKSPVRKIIDGEEKKNVGTTMQKIGNAKIQVAREIRYDAEQWRTHAAVYTGEFKDRCELNAKKMDIKAEKLEKKAKKILDKADKIIAEGETKINNVLKVSY